MTKRLLFFTVFSSGMATLAFELSASRLIGPYFGVSNLVWAAIIGLILIYLAVGYFLGGRLADRFPRPQVMFTLLAWGAFTAGLIPFLAGFILRPAAEAFDQFQLGILFGSFVTILMLFILPITLLGTISPFAIRLAIDDPSKAGSVSGKIYAVSTLGSFVGTFLPDLILIPLVGTRSTYFIFSFFLLSVALLGLWRVSGFRQALKLIWMVVALIGIAYFSLSTPLKNSQGQIFEGESAYNYIQVIEKDGYRYLHLNEGQGIHSVYHPTQISFGGTWDQFLAAPFFNQPPFTPDQVKSMAIIGLAAGTTARQVTEAYGPILIDGFEIDSEIIDVGREYFGMNQPNLNAIAVDGRWGLAQSNRKYDLVGIDAYRPPYIPWHLTTQEFFREVRDHLTENGTLAINVGRAPEDRRLINVLVSTLKTVFPSVFVMDVPGSFNSIIYATVVPSTWDNLVENYQILTAAGETSPLILESIYRALVYQQPLNPSVLVFTDDRAPVEWITHSLIFNFVIAGGTEDLQ